MFLKLIFNITLWCLVTCKDGPKVSTPLGEIKGFYSQSRDSSKISAFTGIPFAEPPIGDLRFKAPVPISPWKKGLRAQKPSPLCVQRNPYMREKKIRGQEDCLYLDIYTPWTENELTNTPSSLLPVMVWIHGGGWMSGGASMYAPDYLLDRQIVLVNNNYRLGPLGFLSTQDEHCPGNNGLKDQQEALRFVQKVISSFGGDPNSVTIFGQSAGGASVQYHMLSETSEGLFHKGISQSGTALGPWAEAPPGEALRRAFHLAQLLNCPQAPSTAMLACIRCKDSYDIINTEYSFYDWDYEPTTPFKAVVEPDLPGAFLKQPARKIPKSKAVPWMTGITRDEGCIKSGLFGDPEHAQGHVSHADDLLHLFPISFHHPTPKDKEISHLMITMWTNFATCGDPNLPEPLPVNWSPASNAQKMEYLEIGYDLTMKQDLAARSRFWRTLPLWPNIIAVAEMMIKYIFGGLTL